MSAMYARMISFVTSPGKRNELCSLIERDIVPLVEQHAGYVEHMTLVAEAEPRLVTVISLWKGKAEAEDYRVSIFPIVKRTLKPLLATEPTVTAFHCFAAKKKRKAPSKTKGMKQ
jgi:hypothetical protein